MKEAMMKSIFLAVLLFLFFGDQSAAQVNEYKRFHLQVHIEGLDTARLSIGSFFSNGYDVDQKQVMVYAGRALFKGMIPHPFHFRLRLTINGKEHLSRFFYVDYKADTQLIRLPLDSFSVQKIAVDNSSWNAEYVHSFLPVIKKNEEAIQQWPVATEKDYQKKKDSLQQGFDRLLTQKDSLLLRYAMKHPSSYVALWELYTRFSLKGYSNIYADAFQLLEDSLKKSLIGVDFSQKLIEAKQLTIGKKFPGVLFLRLDSTARPINYASNKYTLVDFWYSYCGPCIKEFPALKKIYQSFHHKGFHVVSVSTDRDEDVKHYNHAIRKYQLRWEHRWDRDGIIATNLVIHSFPTNFLIDQKGIIIAKNIKPAQLAAFLAKQLK